MLAGEPPFTGPTVAAIVAKRISTPPPHVSTVRDIPPHVDVAVTRALARAGRSLRDRVGDGRRSRSTRVGFRVQGSRLEPPRGARGRTGRRSFRGRAGAAGPTCARWAAVSVSPRCWRAASAARPTEDLGAYDLYLKGRFAWNRRTGRSLTQAASWFDQAIARDSGFARAWAGVADTYILLPGYTGADQATSWRAQRRLPPEHSPSTRFCRRRSPRSPTGPGCRSRSICGEPRPGASPHFHELERRAKREFVGPFAFATIYAALGDRDRGVDWLLRGIEQGHNFMTENFFDPLLDPLRKDQRYPEVLAGMGLGS
jgi:hypothetical protein